MLKRAMGMAAMVLLFGTCQEAVALAAAEEHEAPESAVSSPPMEMDDPGTPGAQGLEVNFVGSHDHTGAARRFEMLLDANYGIGDRIQLKYERPYVTEAEEDIPSQRGLGATEVGIKWRAVDHAGLAVAVYPNYQWDDGFKVKDAEGVAQESEGRSFYFPVLISEEVGHNVTLGVNLGFRRNLEGRGDDCNVAFGVGRAVPGDGRVLAEVFSERDPHLHNRQTDVRVGYVFMLFPAAWVPAHLELPAYASVGHSIGATEAGETSTSFTFGVSIIKTPKQ